MNTITIDSDMYKGAVEYAERYNMSIKDVVEHGIQLLIGNISNNSVAENKVRRINHDEAMNFVKTLSASGGLAVPADENGIGALIEKKYGL